MTSNARARRIRQSRVERRQLPGSGLSRFVAATAGLLLLLIVAIPLSVLAFGVGIYLFFAKDLAPPEAIAQSDIAESTKIFDRKGKLLYEIFDPQGGRRTLVKLSDIPESLKLATIATEDATFYDNVGVNVQGIARAAIVSFRAGEPIQGGSSITQQLVKNVLIPQEEWAERRLTRKIKEAILAVELTRRYSKDQILEWYFNWISYGNLSYGVEAAAQSYFGKSVRDLTLAESAMLAGLPQAPALYSPIINPEAAKRRQEEVLLLMVRQGFITEEQAATAAAQKLHFAPQRFGIQAPHFVMYVREQLAEKYGQDIVERGGLQVTTSLDLDLQHQAERIIREHIANGVSQNITNGALVAIRPQTGEVIAMVGSADYFDAEIDGQVNIALAERQPGSTFKPFTYVTTFMKGYAPATMLLDIPTSFPDGQGTYRPNNVDFKFRGPVSIRTALANSLNIPAVRALQYAGIDDLLKTAHRMGINSLTKQNTYGLSLTLGGGEVKLLDLTYAYSVFANNGTMIGQPVPLSEWEPGFRELDPVTILKVTDSQGRVLQEYKEPQMRPVIAPEYAFQITSILSDNEARRPFYGENNPMKLPDRPAAAKTGTTDDNQDAWTIGYTPDLVAGVWVGNADHSPMQGGFGSTTAAPIWREFMMAALEGTPPSPFQEPPGLEHVRVCPVSGLLPTPYCPTPIDEIFVKGKAPTRTDNMHQAFKIDKTNGKLATAATPPQNVEEKVFLVVPPEALAWAKSAGVPQPPTEYSAGVVPGALTGPAIVSPAAGSYVRGNVVITGSTYIPNVKSYRVEVGEGTNPTSWASLDQPGSGPVDNGTLAIWDASGLEGPYTLRFTVEPNEGETRQIQQAVIVDNIAPAVTLSQPSPNSTITAGPDGQHRVRFEATATDNLGVATVEFRVDGDTVGRADKEPFAFDWNGTPGQHKVTAIARDRAGNETTTAEISITVQE